LTIDLLVLFEVMDSVVSSCVRVFFVCVCMCLCVCLFFLSLAPASLPFDLGGLGVDVGGVEVDTADERLLDDGGDGDADQVHVIDAADVQHQQEQEHQHQHQHQHQQETQEDQEQEEQEQEGFAEGDPAADVEDTQGSDKKKEKVQRVTVSSVGQRKVIIDGCHSLFHPPPPPVFFCFNPPCIYFFST
jgi:hypothetical protein